MAYPVLLLRLKAVMIDSLALTLVYFAMLAVCIRLDIASPTLKAFVMLVPTILFEPVMVWLTGGSLGHHYAGIKIIDEGTGKNLPIHRGIIRLGAKTILGIFSFLTMLITKQNRAIHDMASGSLVLFIDEAAAPAHHKLPARSMDYTEEKPSIVRRLVVSLIYSLLSYIILTMVIALLTWHSCIKQDVCTETESVYMLYLPLSFFVILPITFALGLACKLPGAFYRTKSS